MGCLWAHGKPLLLSVRIETISAMHKACAEQTLADKHGKETGMHDGLLDTLPSSISTAKTCVGVHNIYPHNARKVAIMSQRDERKNPRSAD